MRIYGDLNSGNCLKVKWTAEYLGLPFTWQPVDMMAGETRTARFLERFPFGQIPAIAFDDGRTLAQSNAIIRYLAHASPLLPDDAFAEAKVSEWLYWEQYSHEPYIGVCRFHMVYEGQPKETREAWRVERGEAALDLMERHLTGRDWFVEPDMTIADISLLAYTRVAHEGGFDLSTRPQLRSWIGRAETELSLAAAA